MNPIILRLTLLGAQAVASGFGNVADAAKSADTQLNQTGKQAQQEMTELTARITGAAEAWSPYIAAVKRAQAEQKKLKDWQTPVNKGAAAAWNPYIAAVQKAKEEQDKLKKWQTPVNAGAASAWNPYISAIKQAEAEQKKLDAETRKLPHALRAAGGEARALWSQFRQGAKVSGDQVDSLIGKMQKLDSAVAKVEFNNLQQSAGDVRNVGLGMMGAGAAGAFVLGTAVNDAGKYAQMRRAFTKNLGSEQAADAYLADLKAFDRSSPYDFQQTVGIANSFLAQGFTKEESKEWMKALGDQVALNPMADSDSLRLAARAIAQVKGNQFLQADEGNQLVEGGGIPVWEILREKLGAERTAKIRAGDEKLSWQEFAPIMLEGMRKRSLGMMGEMNQELPGQISNLKSALYQLGVAIGTYVIPPVQWLVGMATGVVDFFNALPAPLKLILGYGAGLITVLLLLGGGILVLVGSVANAVLSIMGLGTTLQGTALAARLASFSFVGLLTTLGLIAAAALVVGFALYVFKQYLDELKNPTASVEDKRTGDQVAQDNASKNAVLQQVESTKNLDPVSRYAVLKAATKKLGELGEADAVMPITKEMETLRKTLSEEQRLRPSLGNEAQAAVSAIASQTANNKAARFSAVERPKNEDPNAASAQSVTQQMEAIKAQVAGGQLGSLPQSGALSTQPMALPSVPVGGALATSGALGNIEALEDAVAMSRKNYNPNSPQEQLRLARRAEKHEREEERERKAQERTQKKAQRDAEREQKQEAREAEKERRLRLSQRNAQADANADVQVAQLDASTKLRIAQMRAMGASPMDIAQVQAQAEMQRAQLRAGGLAEDDDLGRSKAMQLGQIKADSILQMAPYQKVKPTMAAALNYLRGGGDVFHLGKKMGGGALAYAGAGGAEYSGGMRPSLETRGNDREVWAEVESQKRQSDGATIVKFRDLRIEPSPFERGLRTLKR